MPGLTTFPLAGDFWGFAYFSQIWLAAEQYKSATSTADLSLKSCC